MRLDRKDPSQCKDGQVTWESRSEISHKGTETHQVPNLEVRKVVLPTVQEGVRKRMNGRYGRRNNE